MCLKEIRSVTENMGGKKQKQKKTKPKPKASNEKAKNLNEKLNIVVWSSSTTTDVI